MMSEGFLTGVSALGAQGKRMDQAQRFVNTTAGSLPSLGFSRLVSCISESSESEGISRQVSKEDLHHSFEVQEAVDAMAFEEAWGIQYSVFVADPAIPNSPLVACSAGFDNSTQTTLDDVVGKNCLSSLDSLEDEEQVVTMGEGEALYIHTNDAKSGKVTSDMFYVKAVELDDTPFIVCLRVTFEEGFDECNLHGARLCNLNATMAVVEQNLASHFWYSSSMRRQN